MISEDNARYLVVLVFALVLTAFGSMLATDGVTGYVTNEEIAGCRYLNESDHVYQLTGDITDNTLSSSCFNVTAENVTLDCQGFFIASNQSVDGIFSNMTNTTVMNCNISVVFSGGMDPEYGYGINFVRANNSVIINNTLNDIGVAIHIDEAKNVWIENNTANLNIYNDVVGNSWGEGVFLVGTQNITVINNNLSSNTFGVYLLRTNSSLIKNNTVNSNKCEGIALVTNSTYNQIINNTLLNSGNALCVNSKLGGIGIYNAKYNNITDNILNATAFSSITLSHAANNTYTSNQIYNASMLTGSEVWETKYYIISLVSSSDNLFEYNQMNNGHDSGIYIYSGDSAGSNNVYSSNNTFRHTNLTNVAATGVVLEDAGSGKNLKNVFLNFSYNSETVGTNSDLTRKWYFETNISYANATGINGATITAWNVTSESSFSDTTDSNGEITRQELIEYKNIGGTKYYATNYTINVSFTGYSDNSTQVNLTENVLYTLISPNIFECMNIDESGAYILNQSFSTNGTCFNITANNVILNFAEFNISGNITSGSHGIFIDSYENATIVNGTIYDFETGIYAEKAFGLLVDNHTIFHEQHVTCSAEFTSCNAVSGIYLDSTNNAVISNSNISELKGINNTGDSGDGAASTSVYLSRSNFTNITGNTFNSNVRGEKNGGFAQGTSRGIYIGISSNNNIINNTINSNGNEGVYISESTDNNIINNTVNSNGDGIELNSVNSGNTIRGNKIYSNTVGIYFVTSTNNTVQDNVINTSSQQGLYLWSDSSNNTFTNNSFWNCSTGDNTGCILVAESNRNIFNVNQIDSSYDFGIIVEGTGSDTASHNIFKNMEITNIDGTSVYIYESSSSSNINNTFLNCSYDNESVDANSELIRKWYLDVNVSNTTDSTPLQNANVTAWNNTGEEQFSKLTASTGLITTQEVTQYENIGGTIVYINYTINATLTGYISNSTQANITGNTLWNISLEIDSSPPVIVAHNLSTTHPNNISVLFNFTDNYLTDTMSINDTINFEMNKTGFLFNISFLGAGQHWLNISANDTSNNTADVEVWVNVSSTTSTTTTVTTETTESFGSGGPSGVGTTTSTSEPTSITTSVTMEETTIPPITTIELEDAGSLPTISWQELYEMVTESINDNLVEPITNLFEGGAKAAVSIIETETGKKLVRLKSVDDKGIDKMMLESENHLSEVDCQNISVCIWIKELSGEEYRFKTINVQGMVTEKIFDVPTYGAAAKTGLTGEKIILGMKLSAQWVFLLLVLLIVFYLIIRTTFHVLKVKRKIKVTKPIRRKDISKAVHGKVIAIRHAFKHKKKKKPKKKKRPTKEIIEGKGVKLFKPAHQVQDNEKKEKKKS